MASLEGNVISIVSCQLFFIERENITSDRVVLAIIDASSIADQSGTGLLEVIKEHTKVWDCLDIRFYWDLGWKGEHGEGLSIPRQVA